MNDSKYDLPQVHSVEMWLWLFRQMFFFIVFTIFHELIVLFVFADFTLEVICFCTFDKL